MIVVGSGSRGGWVEPEEAAVFDGWLRRHGAVFVRVGECTGVDAELRGYMLALGWPVQVWHAPWGKHPRAGGPIRNREMIRGEQREVVEVEHLGSWSAIWDRRWEKARALVHWPGNSGTASARLEAARAKVRTLSIESIMPGSGSTRA